MRRSIIFSSLRTSIDVHTQTKIDVFWPYVELSQSDLHVENIAGARFGRFRRASVQKISSGR